MKKIARILSVLVAAVMLMTALSVTVSASDDTPYDAFADYGQQTHNVPPPRASKSTVSSPRASTPASPSR